MLMINTINEIYVAELIIATAHNIQVINIDIDIDFLFLTPQINMDNYLD